MSDYFGCKNCSRSHMGGLSCFYGISKRDRYLDKKSYPDPGKPSEEGSGKKSTARKLLKNSFRKSDTDISFKKYCRLRSRKVPGGVSNF